MYKKKMAYFTKKKYLGISTLEIYTWKQETEMFFKIELASLRKTVTFEKNNSIFFCQITV